MSLYLLIERVNGSFWWKKIQMKLN
jgi:hypothetical protein